jgi:hypothetical protein
MSGLWIECDHDFAMTCVSGASQLIGTLAFDRACVWAHHLDVAVADLQAIGLVNGPVVFLAFSTAVEEHVALLAPLQLEFQTLSSAAVSAEQFVLLNCR